MRAYVQQVPQSSSIHLAMLQAGHWFWQRGYEVIPFAFENVAAGKLDDDLLRTPDEMVVRAGVEVVRQMLVRAGRPLPPNIDLPESLAPWIGRSINRTTFGEVRAMVASGGAAMHVKPLTHHKLFTGRVVGAFRDLIPLAGVPDETAVLVQGCVDFASEWRATILRGEILNVANYKGDPLLFPDRERMVAALRAFDEQPIGFAMDWGVTASGETLLVEVNDGYSLGNYGVHGAAYTAVIEARWRQLMGLRDNGVGLR